MRERDLFIEALQQDNPAARDAFLAAACAGDDQLLLHVERLLLEHERQESFILDALPPGIEPTVLAVPGEQPGTQIGPYKLLQQIGEGGMGVVYMAEQTEPVERRVALKIVKPGMDSRTVMARFDAERHALAVMDHPHIARVLDAGTTDSGRPYFVMELVKGTPITNYCDDHNLTPRQRLELFIPVCEAVQHAHQKGIIHRDLKPSNVLVALYDDKPVPKVIDFGVAKATGRKLTEQTLFTEFGAIVGTLEYMSPEQANLNELDIDTRSDVYSLGVLLYELLTGTTPLQRKTLKEAALLEMLRIVREVEPPKPSDRLTTTEELPSIAAHRGLEPKKLSGLVRGELDWIVMKCLEKERGRRYETANGLAMDLRRYLADEAVLACPPSRIYRLRKFARRNRPALVASAVLAGSLILGTVVSTWQAIRATSAERLAREQRELAETARQEAEVQRELAQENFRQARQAVDEYFTLVSESKLLDVPGLQPLRKQLLEAALRYHRDFASQKSDDPQMLADLASSYLRVAMIDNAVSRNDDAVAALEQALTLVERLRRDYPHATEQHRALAGFWKGLRATQIVSGMPKDPQKARRVLARFADLWEAFIGENPTVTGFQSDLVALNGIQASLLNSLGQHGDTVTLLQNSRLIGEKLVRDNPAVPEFRADLARTYDFLADALRVAGRTEEAEQLRSQVLTLSEQAATHAAGTPQHQLEFARNLELLAARLGDRREFPQAEKTIRQSVEIFQMLVDEHPEAPLYHQRLHRAQTGLARLLSSTGRPAEAEAVLRIVLERQANLLAKHAEQIEWASAREYTNSLVQLVSLLRSTGRVAEAETVIRQTIGHLERLTAEFADQPQVLELLAEAQLHYADFLAALNRPDAALSAYRACVEQRERVARDFPENQIVNNLGHSYRIYAGWLNTFGQSQGAEEIYRKAVAVFDKLAADNADSFEYRHFSADTRRYLGQVLSTLKRPQEAEDAFRRAVEIHERREAELPGQLFNENEVADAIHDLARFLIEAGRSDEARDVYRQAIKVSHRNPNTLHAFALGLHGTGAHAEAESAYRQALAAYRSRANDNRPDIARCLYDLARVLSEQDKYVEAEDLCREALTLRRQAHGDADERVAADLELLALLFHRQNKPLADLERSFPDAEAIWSKQTPEQLNGIAWRLVTDPNSGNRDADLAVGLAKRAVARAPDQGYMVNTLGTAYYRAGDWQSAIETLKQADELYQGQFFSSDAFFIAMSHWQLADKDAALKWHNAAAAWMQKFAADNEEQRRFRAECAALLGVSETAPATPEQAPSDERDIYTLIVDAWPEAAWAYLARSLAHKRAGETDQAQADYRQTVKVLDAAIAQTPDSVQPWMQRGHAHAMFEQWAEAASDLDQAVDLGASPAVWYQAALVRLGGSDTAGYHQACDRISARLGELDTSDAAGLALWAYALAPDATADLAPVIALAEKSAQENPQSLQRVNTWGALWYRAGRLDEALGTLIQADQLAQKPGSNSSPAYAWFFLAMTHHRRGNPDEARTWLAKACSAVDEAFQNDQAGTARLPWNRRLTLSLLRSEAEALLGVK